MLTDRRRLCEHCLPGQGGSRPGWCRWRAARWGRSRPWNRLRAGWRPGLARRCSWPDRGKPGSAAGRAGLEAGGKIGQQRLVADAVVEIVDFLVFHGFMKNDLGQRRFHVEGAIPGAPLAIVETRPFRAGVGVGGVDDAKVRYAKNSSSTPIPGAPPYSATRRALVALSSSEQFAQVLVVLGQGRQHRSLPCRRSARESGGKCRSGARRPAAAGGQGVAGKITASAARVEQLAHGLHGQQAAGQHLRQGRAATEDRVFVG